MPSSSLVEVEVDVWVEVEAGVEIEVLVEVEVWVEVEVGARGSGLGFSLLFHFFGRVGGWRFGE